MSIINVNAVSLISWEAGLFDKYPLYCVSIGGI